MATAGVNMDEEWEKSLRVKLAFICMAAVAGKEGDLRALTDDLVRFCRGAQSSHDRMQEPYVVPASATHGPR